MARYTFNYLFVLSAFCLFFSCKTVNHLAKFEEQRISVEEEHLAADPEITALIAPYKLELDKVMEAVIGQSGVDLEKRRPEGTLGNWMADAIQRKAEKYLGEPVDFAIQNYGGIRIPVIKKGAITRGKIYELMPFDNKIVILYLNKVEVEELVAHLMKSKGWPVSSTIQIKQLSVEDIMVAINGKAMEEGITYKVAVPDYIANGGSGSFFLKDKKRKDLNILIRDALIEDVIDHADKQEAIQSTIEGRFVLMED